MSQPSGPVLPASPPRADEHLATALQLLESGAYELAVIAAQLQLRDVLRCARGGTAPATAHEATAGHLPGGGPGETAELLRHLGRFHDALAGAAELDHSDALDSIITVWNLSAPQPLS